MATAPIPTAPTNIDDHLHSQGAALGPSVGQASDDRTAHLSHQHQQDITHEIHVGDNEKDALKNKDALAPPPPAPPRYESQPRLSGTGHVHYVADETAREEEVRKLARRMTQRSHLSLASGRSGRSGTSVASSANPFDPEQDSKLDPASANFSARAWTKSLVKLRSRHAEAYPDRTAGVAFRNLNAYGYNNETDYQKTVGGVLTDVWATAKSLVGLGKPKKIQILRDFDGLVRAGEMLVVLGPPGSGCSTFLKTIAGETHGFYVDEKSYINYQGISAKQMHSDFRGEAIYTAEVDVHFPMLSVGDTLSFAAYARSPRRIPGGLTRHEYADHMRDVVMAMFGISHTINTRVGNDFIRGVSGGERKRVSIAEAALSNAPLQCWDNSTRGLDSANAIEFCKTLQLSTDMLGATACVAIYQAPQSAYDLFDKVTVLYEGRQIYFGGCEEAKQFWIDVGFHCPDRQTTADFLTSLTSAKERIARAGYEDKVPRTPDEFVKVWKSSEQYKRLIQEIEAYDKEFAIGGDALAKFQHSRRMQQAKHQSVSSPYTLSYTQQVKLCLWRGFQRLRGDPSLTLTQLFGNFIMSLIIGSVFYNLPENTSSFYSRGALLFFAILMNAFGSALEILTLYAQRPIVEKHTRYALYHPSAEAVASMLTDMPYKILNAIIFNITLYFMTNLRREPGPFFFFVLTSFVLTLAMSMMFRTIASSSRSLHQALAPAAVLILGLVLYTGFAIPTRDMLGWSRWINYLDPIAYGFESLMVNEFHNRVFPCSTYIPFGPGYEGVAADNTVCMTVGSIPGTNYVDGDRYIQLAYEYTHAHKWRNIGIMVGFMFGFGFLHLLTTEFISAKKSKGEVLLFRRGHLPASLTTLGNGNGNKKGDDVEMGGVGNGGVARHALGGKKEVDVAAVIQKQTAVFHWQDVCYDITIKGEHRRILDHVDGWVKPGTLTALMGVSGAGKTTLLDVLATRVTMGVVTGEMLVDGQQRDTSFQRKTGYVQQQDLHLETSTVREALTFSALMRQPRHISRDEKIAYVDEVIKLLDMEDYADAVVGVPGEGLNVEQRKRLTIGVELAAKPQLLLFLDEPTSGLDSQTSWAICDLMEKLTKNGQAILCTIHQPSAMLFQRFERLLFLAKGGRTVYFGDIGKNSEVLTSYFERNGAFPCPPGANPAEWMLEVIGAAPGSHTEIDWHQTWKDSPEFQGVRNELARMKEELPVVAIKRSEGDIAQHAYDEFAAPLGEQMVEVTKRVFQQYWRSPVYIFSKTALCVATALFIGFSFFKAANSQQGLQNQMFSLFLMLTVFGQLVQQIMPHFVIQRSLYEVRERPSKTYSWKAFMLSNIIVEIPWQTLMAILMYVCWYYPIGMYRNAIETDAVAERGFLMFLFIWAFLLFTSTFTDMCIAGMDSAETAGNLAQLAFSLCLIFCGVLAGPDVLPRFWIWMYRVSPFTYLIDGMLATGVANTNVVCSDIEFLVMNPVSGQTCLEYLEPYTSAMGGYVGNPSATSECQLCPIGDTNVFLKAVSSDYGRRWRNFGLLWVYIVFNAGMAVFIYWWVRVPKTNKKEEKKKKN
ncbi:putative multidrug resistance ABC transporter [Gaertneriomyces semiglobifer]|nr:putative multidrug resistance ABC transporter [Gaertneriomyces semiglobifer]